MGEINLNSCATCFCSIGLFQVQTIVRLVCCWCAPRFGNLYERRRVFVYFLTRTKCECALLSSHKHSRPIHRIHKHSLLAPTMRASLSLSLDRTTPAHCEATLPNKLAGWRPLVRIGPTLSPWRSLAASQALHPHAQLFLRARQAHRPTALLLQVAELSSDLDAP